MDQISVVIPMYNSENTIERTLLSVVNQTYQGGLEIIVVNDGSTDNSMKVVENFILQNPGRQIKLINQPNGGVSKARNAGMKIAKGDYIALLDSDDEWLPNKIEQQMSHMHANPDIDLIGTTRNGEKFSSFFFKHFTEITEISSKLLLFKNFFPTPTVLFKKNILSEIGYFDEKQKYAEEGDYWIRICNEKKCFLLNQSLVLAGDGKPSFGHSGLSANLRQMELGELKNIKTAKRLKIINNIEYIYISAFSIFKYMRRVLITKLR